MNRFVFKISKVVVFTLLFVGFATAQNPLELYTTPAGTLDDAFDRFGEKYKLSALKKPESNFTPFALPVNTISTSRFNLYYESGCGMELTTNTTHIARRKIVEKVLEDVSAFMNLPFSETKVNIWVRNLANVTTNTNQTMSVGSSFYNVPKNATGSITDGEVWKTLLSGNDSYTNVTPTTDAYYHGMLAFNFATYNSATIKWHTKLESNPAAGFYDFYSAVLREVVHLLGITSLIDPNGNSVFGTDYKYYSRYDRLLKNNANTQFLLKNTGTVGMYNYSFNTALSPTILRPGCSLPNYTNPSPADATTCANALKYVGSTTLPVYTPTCFEKGVSLSHFEDQLFPSCTAAYGNNSYFVMSNKSNLQSVKRYLKPQERLALADLGYPLKTIYGTTTTLNGYYNYGGSPTASALVVGVNDGINPDGSYAFYGTQNQNITISGAQILANDTNATAFEGLQDLTAPATTTLSTTTGNASTTITFTSTTPGLHLLRYMPKNAAGQTGNVTYFYAYVSPNNNCATTPVCNLVYNGDFEQNNGQIPTLFSQINYACNWGSHGGGTPDYLHANSSNFNIKIPQNFFGYQNVNNDNGSAYAGFYYSKSAILPVNFYSEILKTELVEPLEPFKTYQLSFDISKGDTDNDLFLKIQAFVTASNLSSTYLLQLTTSQASQGVLMTNNDFSIDSINWERITFNFNSSGNEKFLYLGGLYNAPSLLTSSIAQQAYYYIDNVILKKADIATNDTYTFSPAATLQTATTTVLTNDTVNGVAFTPPAVGVTVAQVSSSNAGVSINPQGFITVAGGTPVGTYTLVYNFTTPCGASNNATVTVEVTSHSVVFEVPGKYACVKSCFSTVAETIDFGFFNPVNWGDYVGLLVNGVPATASMVTVHLAPGSTLPAGVTLNPNGTLTIPSSYQLDLFTFSVVFCSIASPNECSEPVRCCFSRDITRTATADTKTYTTNGFPVTGQNNLLLTNDYLSCYNATVLMNTIPATPTNSLVVETTSPANPYFTIGANGQINVGSYLTFPVGTYILTYKLCSPLASYICSDEVTVTINVQSASGRQSLPKHKPTQTKVTQSTTDPIIYIPDANLKARLCDTSGAYAVSIDGTSDIVDTNFDGEIQVSEALDISMLLLQVANISDLTGLEYFTNLTHLYIHTNNISNLQPIENLTLLKLLSAGSNSSLTSFNTVIYPDLESFGCQQNPIVSLDFSNNPIFKNLGCNNTPTLTYLNIKNNYMHVFPSGDPNFCFPSNLTYICADAMEIPALQSFLTGCGYNLANITITSDCALSEHSFSKNVVKVFPNPSNTGVFSVELPVVSKGKAMVYNALGQKVYENTFVNQTFTLPLNFLPKNTYFLKLITENQEVFEEKLVVN